MLPEGLRPPAQLRLTAALLATFELPGLLLVLLWPRRLELDLLEAVAYGFAISAIGLTVLGIVAIELGPPLQLLQWTPVALSGGMCLVLIARLATLSTGARWPAPAVDLRPRPAALLLLALVLLTAALAQQTGGLRHGNEPDLVEEASQIVIVQRVASEPRLTAAGLMYMRGVQPTYYYPTYQFGLGLAARLAGVPPVAAFSRVRGVGTLLALTGTYAAAVALLGSRLWARVILLSGVAMALSGQLSAPPEGLYWSPLAPLAHAADFSLGVVVPIGLAFAGRVVRPRTSWFFTVGAALFLVAAMSLHSKEVLHLLTFYAAGLATLLVITPRQRNVLVRAAALVVVTVAAARGYQLMVSSRVAYLSGFVEAQRGSDLSLLQSLVERGDWLARGSVQQLTGQFPPLPYLALLLAPALLLFRGRRPGAILLAAGILFWALLTNVALLERLFAVLTFSEILWLPSRYLVLPGIVAVGTIVLLMAGVLGELASPGWGGWPGLGRAIPARWRRVAAAVAALLCVSPLFRIALSVPGRAGPPAVTAMALVGAAAVLLWRRGRPVDGWEPARLLHGPALLQVLCLTPPLIGLSLSSFSVPLWQAATLARNLSPVEDFDRWYAQTSFARTLPLPLLRRLERAAPGQVVVVEPSESLILPMFVPQYVLYAGGYFSTDLRFLDQWEAEQPPGTRASGVDQRMAELARLYREVRPIFNEAEDNQQTLRYLSAWDVGFVVVDPARHTRLRRLLDSRPDLFAPVVETPQRLLYEVRAASPR